MPLFILPTQIIIFLLQKKTGQAFLAKTFEQHNKNIAIADN
jgi:hypothetical protein